MQNIYTLHMKPHKFPLMCRLQPSPQLQCYPVFLTSSFTEIITLPPLPHCLILRRSEKLHLWILLSVTSFFHYNFLGSIHVVQIGALFSPFAEQYFTSTGGCSCAHWWAWLRASSFFYKSSHCGHPQSTRFLCTHYSLSQANPQGSC